MCIFDIGFNLKKPIRLYIHIDNKKSQAKYTFSKVVRRVGKNVI